MSRRVTDNLAKSTFLFDQYRKPIRYETFHLFDFIRRWRRFPCYFMLGVTALELLSTPVFYVLTRKFARDGKTPDAVEKKPAEQT